ncbi:protein RIC-3 isoform X3 [Hemicordylus capensis]|uniref:protein RIC-3 isoform X3 n=1 Tax=Hemicordylus capensis TaxID=884348 RepID=UPI002303D229|nr:protein RIC-3 isoform X3 [Hemicordylus capensis]
MAYSTFRKVALASCVVLCVSLLLPKVFLSRSWKQQEPAHTASPTPAVVPEGKTGQYPPTMHHQISPEVNSPATHFPRSHVAEAVAKAKGGGGGGGGGGSGGSGGSSGRGLVGQVIPIYGFGILLYILYILFKLSSKGKTTTVERKCPPSASGNMNRKITDYELAQLQDKLRETEEAMEKLINRVGPNCESRVQNVTSDQEKRLLQQLREITKVMKEGKLIDGVSPEKEAEEAPYMQDWEVNNDPAAGHEKDRHATLSAQSGAGHNFEKCYCCHYEEDDPVVIAENAGFCSDSCSETEEPAKQELSVDSDHENATPQDQSDENLDEIGLLRKRNTKGPELLGH